MAHQVTFEIKKHVLRPKKGVNFEVRSGGKLLGTLNVGTGDIRWFPKNAKNASWLRWKEFDKLMVENGWC